MSEVCVQSKIAVCTVSGAESALVLNLMALHVAPLLHEIKVFNLHAHDSWK